MLERHFGVSRHQKLAVPKTESQKRWNLGTAFWFHVRVCVATASASYRIEKPRRSRKWEKNIGKKLEIPSFCLIFLFFANFSPIFRSSGVFLFCSWPTRSQCACLRWPDSQIRRTEPPFFANYVSGHTLGPVHGRTDFSRIFIFGPPDFVADFLAGFFLLIFVGKGAQKNPPTKSPGKSSKIWTTIIPDTFLQRGRANTLHIANRRVEAIRANCSNVMKISCEGFIRHSPPLEPTLESASPSHPQGSNWHRNRVKSGNWCRIAVECKLTFEKGRARRIRGWGPGSLCLINPSKNNVFRRIYSRELFFCANRADSRCESRGHVKCVCVCLFGVWRLTLWMVLRPLRWLEFFFWGVLTRAFIHWKTLSSLSDKRPLLLPFPFLGWFLPQHIPFPPFFGVIFASTYFLF